MTLACFEKYSLPGCVTRISRPSIESTATSSFFPTKSGYTDSGYTFIAMPRACVFLDRDGVINEKPAPHDYVRTWSDFKFLPNISDWIRLFNALGYLVVVISNQRGVARGLMSAGDVEGIHHNMVAELARRGAIIDDIFYCPHQDGECNCRKPLPGLVIQAQEKWGLDLSKSLLIGDSDADEQLAAACGIRFLRAEGGQLV